MDNELYDMGMNTIEKLMGNSECLNDEFKKKLEENNLSIEDGKIILNMITNEFKDEKIKVYNIKNRLSELIFGFKKYYEMKKEDK